MFESTPVLRFYKELEWQALHQNNMPEAINLLV
jgi:hypothetical protein